MAVTLCVLLWAVPDREQELVDYEDRVLPLLGDHDGRLTSRVRAIEAADGPFEVHTIEFASEIAFEGYMSDPARAAMAAERDAAIARTEVIRVETVV